MSPSTGDRINYVSPGLIAGSGLKPGGIEDFPLARPYVKRFPDFENQILRVLRRLLQPLRKLPFFILAQTPLASPAFSFQKSINPSFVPIRNPVRDRYAMNTLTRFSLTALVNIATALGRRVHVELEAA
jgi:hypothetical protein